VVSAMRVMFSPDVFVARMASSGVCSSMSSKMAPLRSWFSGAASRGRYAALLHSSMLVVICYLCFVGAGMV